jgi:hypothetical protein
VTRGGLRVVYASGRFTGPGDVVHSWDLVVLHSEPGDLHCAHCRSNVRGLFCGGRLAFTAVEHDPACPWLRAEPPFDPSAAAHAESAPWS